MELHIITLLFLSLGLPVSLISGPVIVEDLGPVTLNPASVSINAGDSVTITALVHLLILE
jgi:hypothetical protein